MNGVELFRRMKQAHPSIKTLLISAFEVKDDLFQGCNCVDKLLQKPIHMSALIEEVNQVLNSLPQTPIIN
jgi:DNA-binding NarL/FixJ family response regulator